MKDVITMVGHAEGAGEKKLWKKKKEMRKFWQRKKFQSESENSWRGPTPTHRQAALEISAVLFLASCNTNIIIFECLEFVSANELYYLRTCDLQQFERDID